jgi:uncharacterized membrane protein YeaQ/YmgE (transglycosylase-associated protein family)
MWSAVNCILTLAVGGLAGYIAGRVLRGKDFGIIGNMVIGLLGSIVGSVAFALLGLQAWGLGGQFMIATVGAVLFIALVRIFIDSEFAK